MIPKAAITAWRAHAPWLLDEQVEQDLVVTRAVVDIFSDPLLAKRLAFRGGTALHKLHLSPAVRYSEDIDLVQIAAEPFGPIMTGLRKRLSPWLGQAKWKQSEGRVTFVFRFASEIPPVTALKLKVEVNTREHFTVLGLRPSKMTVTNPWFTAEADVVSYELEELLGTKLRALYQRKKGRDLFDLAVALEAVPTLDAARVIQCFAAYLKHEGKAVTRAAFERNLAAKIDAPEFYSDVTPLLASTAAESLDRHRAFALVSEKLVSLLPGDPWKGAGGAGGS
jgi:predicted nucleotidyltransferase component of viral defense system